MPFWLCENRFIGLLRTISLQKQIVITLCCTFIATGGTIVLKQLTLPLTTQTNKPLHQALHTMQLQKIQKITSMNRTQLAPHKIPQTLNFFTNAGFHVHTVDQLLSRYNNQNAGYVVSVQGSFGTLMNFLTTRKEIPATQLSLSTISRITDSTIEIEFFMPKRQL